MTVEGFRDLAIIIAALVAVAALVFRTVVDYLIYRRVKRILASIEAACSSAQAISSLVEGLMKPLATIINFIRGVFQGSEEVSKAFQKGGKNE